jgi:hypothetical protein
MGWVGCSDLFAGSRVALVEEGKESQNAKGKRQKAKVKRSSSLTKTGNLESGCLPSGSGGQVGRTADLKDGGLHCNTVNSCFLNKKFSLPAPSCATAHKVLFVRRRKGDKHWALDGKAGLGIEPSSAPYEALNRFAARGQRQLPRPAIAIITAKPGARRPRGPPFHTARGSRRNPAGAGRAVQPRSRWRRGAACRSRCRATAPREADPDTPRARSS